MSGPELAPDSYIYFQTCTRHQCTLLGNNPGFLDALIICFHLTTVEASG